MKNLRFELLSVVNDEEKLLKFFDSIENLNIKIDNMYLFDFISLRTNNKSVLFYLFDKNALYTNTSLSIIENEYLIQKKKDIERYNTMLTSVEMLILEYL